MANIVEQQLLGFTLPGRILNNLDTFNYHGASHNSDIQSSITVLIQKTHASSKPIPEVRHALIDFMTNNAPQHLQHNGVIRDDIVKNLKQVVFDGESVVKTISFKDDNWSEGRFTLALEDDLDHDIVYDDKFKRSCRKLAVALVALNIRGNRFIRADRLIDTFYQGNTIGRTRKADDRRKMFEHLHKVTADELWSGNGIVVKKWVADNYNEDDDPFKDCYFQY